MKLPDFFPGWHPYGFFFDLSGIKRLCNLFVLALLVGGALAFVMSVIYKVR